MSVPLRYCFTSGENALTDTDLLQDQHFALAMADVRRRCAPSLGQGMDHTLLLDLTEVHSMLSFGHADGISSLLDRFGTTDIKVLAAVLSDIYPGYQNCHGGRN